MKQARESAQQVRRRSVCVEWAAVAALNVAAVSLAFGAPATQPSEEPKQASETPPADTKPGVALSGPEAFTLKPVRVTAERREEDLQNVPQSLIAVTSETIRDAGIRDIRGASFYVPNLNLNQFTVDRLSFPYVRGIGSGRNSPAVTTYIDDVPQLSFATSNVEFLNVDRVEFLRGPQGTLYGRNTLGGVINIHNAAASLDRWEAEATADIGNYGYQDYRATVSGPILPGKLAISVGAGYMSRNGYTENDLTGEKIDDKDHLFGRMELRFTPTENWDIRLTFNGERDRDGDYALFDLNSLIAKPRHLTHDFVGFSDRDVGQVALTARRTGDSVDFLSITALQHWRSQDVTDLDASAADFIRRNNKESEQNFIQEFRLLSNEKKPIVLGDDMKLRWVAGAFFFANDTNQYAYNEFRPGAVGVIPQIFFPFKQFQDSNLGSYGVSVYGQATLAWHKFELIGGLRYDYEHKQAEIDGFGDSQFIPRTRFEGSDDFDQFSPQVMLAYHLSDQVMLYGSAAKGFKAGGFNQDAPADQHVFGQETAWSYEAGLKTSLLNNKLRINADYFYIDWDNLQLDTPTGSPGVFFIDNAGKATSHGLEVEADALLVDDPRGLGTLTLFGGAGILNTNFGKGTLNQGADIGGNRLPYAPDYTANAGVQYSRSLSGNVRLYARAEVQSVGRFVYDASNAASQDTYTIANFRVGVGGDAGKVAWRVEGFLNNAFNAEYVPLAFPFSFAGSGYVGESGAPQTAGITLGVSY